MRMKLALAAVAALLFTLPAFAQQQPIMATVVGTCGGVTYVAGVPRPVTQDTTGALCSASSGGGSSPAPYQLTPVVGSQAALAVPSSTALTVPATAKYALITVESNATYSAAVNCWTDGTVPTAAQGNTIVPNGSYWIASTALASVKCIQVAASAAIDVSYFK